MDPAPRCSSMGWGLRPAPVLRRFRLVAKQAEPTRAAWSSACLGWRDVSGRGPFRPLARSDVKRGQGRSRDDRIVPGCVPTSADDHLRSLLQAGSASARGPVAPEPKDRRAGRGQAPVHQSGADEAEEGPAFGVRAGGQFRDGSGGYGCALTGLRPGAIWVPPFSARNDPVRDRASSGPGLLFCQHSARGALPSCALDGERGPAAAPGRHAPWRSPV